MLVSENRKTLGRREFVCQSRAEMQLLCLIMEHESKIGRLAADVLQQEEFGVLALPMTTDTIPDVERLRPSLVIIETASARGSSLGLCLAIRRTGTPVILLSANASEEERILGLDSGADDYITESSSGREIVARVRAVLRRFTRRDPRDRMPRTQPPFAHPATGTLIPNMMTGDIEVDPSAMRVSVRGSEVETTNLEFRFLYYLVHNQGRVFTRDQLLDKVWGAHNHVELRSVDACVRRLRRKIEPDPVRPSYLKTVRGAGYRLQVAAD
ncbi:MAG: response regulator transcription factor [Candidatus Sulfotelmatobacter sp.]